jgi:glycosyltransferase involved in cell wall biosynthesis
MTDKLPISVIIPAKNAERTITACLSCIAANNPAEIILIDGNSSDRTVDLASPFITASYSDDGRGPGFAHQLGVEKANQEYVSYVDADIILSDHTLEDLLNDLRASNCVTMQAMIMSASLSTYWERVADWRFKRFQKRSGGMLSAVVSKKETVLKYGFDPLIKYAGDDYDFEQKVKKSGAKMGTSDTVVLHYHRSDMKNIFKQSSRNGRGAVFFIKKFGPWDIRRWPPLVIFYWVPVCIINGKLNYILFFLIDSIAGLHGMIIGTADLLKQLRG